jgi:DNA-binding response OmpR family regulator
LQEENHLLVIEETGGGAVYITLLNLAAEGSDGIAAIRDVIKDDSSAVIVLMIPSGMADSNVITQGVKACARAYIKKPISGEEMKKRLSRILTRSEGK